MSGGVLTISDKQSHSTEQSKEAQEDSYVLLFSQDDRGRAGCSEY